MSAGHAIASKTKTGRDLLAWKVETCALTLNCPFRQWLYTDCAATSARSFIRVPRFFLNVDENPIGRLQDNGIEASILVEISKGQKKKRKVCCTLVS